MQQIPEYPAFSPISKNFRSELYPLLNMVSSGISEFTFAGLYLFRKSYHYELSWLPGKKLLIKGIKDGKRFFSLPLGFPQDPELKKELLQSTAYIRNLSESQANEERAWLHSIDFTVSEHRDNFDYIYLSEDLATLSGRKYHKKRNQVHAFVNNYSKEVCPLNKGNIDDALYILDAWRELRDNDGDYLASNEALELQQFLNLDGYLVYADGKPAAYTMGEGIATKSTYLVHIEKAIGHYRGIYQFINQASASALSKNFHYINRAQDLGDAGMRQAKMTYRPSEFIKKYLVCATGSQNIPANTPVLSYGEK